MGLKQAEEIIKVKTEKQGKNKINREESMKPNVVLWKKKTKMINWFFEINLIKLARLNNNKEKRQKLPILETKVSSLLIPWTLKGYCRQLYSHKYYNLDEKDQFLKNTNY